MRRLIVLTMISVFVGLAGASIIALAENQPSLVLPVSDTKITIASSAETFPEERFSVGRNHINSTLVVNDVPVPQSKTTLTQIAPKLKERFKLIDQSSSIETDLSQAPAKKSSPSIFWNFLMMKF